MLEAGSTVEFGQMGRRVNGKGSSCGEQRVYRPVGSRSGVALVSLVLVFACQREPRREPSVSQSVASATPATNPHAAQSAASAGSGRAPLGVSWFEPKPFQRVPRETPMRKATYLVPRAKGDSQDGELVVFYFGPDQGGGVDANISRWIGQFEGAKPADIHRAERSANGLKQHTVEVERGTFSSQMPGDPSQPKQDFALLGDNVESTSGSNYYNLTCPRATVKASRDAFYELLDTVKPTH